MKEFHIAPVVDGFLVDGNPNKNFLRASAQKFCRIILVQYIELWQPRQSFQSKVFLTNSEKILFRNTLVLK